MRQIIRLASCLLLLGSLLPACTTKNDTDQTSTESPTTTNSTAEQPDSTGHDEAHDDD